MTEEEFQALQDKHLSTAGIKPPPTKLNSAVRGAASGLLGGFQPQFAGLLEKITPKALGGTSYDEGQREAEMLNDAAMKENPVSYGAGYAGGTGAQMLAAAPLGIGSKVGGAIKAAKLKLPGAMDDTVNALRGISPKTSNLLSKATSSPVNQQLAARTTGAVVNTPSFDSMQQYLSEEEKRKQAMQEVVSGSGSSDNNPREGGATGSW